MIKYDTSDMLHILRQGEKLGRLGWNGKGMYIYLVPAKEYPAVTDIARAEFGDMVPYREYVAMKTAQGDVIPWVCSQSDLLAKDWIVIK